MNVTWGPSFDMRVDAPARGVERSLSAPGGRTPTDAVGPRIRSATLARTCSADRPWLQRSASNGRGGRGLAIPDNLRCAGARGKTDTAVNPGEAGRAQGPI